MIQRIQSVLILFSSIALGLEFLFPFATSSKEGTGFLSDSIYNTTDSSVLLGLVIGAIIISLIAIFLFKNRKLQMSVNWVAIVLCILIPVAAYFLLSQNQSSNINGVSFGVGAFLPLVSAILLLVANRFISKDENLVKSMDRLR